jgi:hypothetical protein
MKTFNTRLAVRNLVIATVLSVAYLLGKHLQENHNTSGVIAFKINSVKNK